MTKLSAHVSILNIPDSSERIPDGKMKRPRAFTGLSVQLPAVHAADGAAAGNGEADFALVFGGLTGGLQYEHEVVVI